MNGIFGNFGGEFGRIPNCRFHFEAVVGEDTGHGGLPGAGVPTSPRQFGMHPSHFLLIW
jgi:hypothetical protein